MAILNVDFYISFTREFYYRMGLISCSELSLLYFLNLFEGSNCCVLPISGAEESLHADPTKLNLVLKNSAGFVKLGIEMK
ncbi:hypothetical protein K502DRAFT_322414 [Neoconidiobolus thromboides FSU 785]|nr:hypothetical protein K502DRAFT_322414 [Neoconidiobolus thromboides FSU 785]